MPKTRLLICSVLLLMALSGCGSTPPAPTIQLPAPAAWLMAPAPDLLSPLNGIISPSANESKLPAAK